MIAYIGAFLWGGAILFSLIGWGEALRLAFFRHEQLDWGLKAAWGMAFSVCLGGVLNLVGMISRGLVLCFLGAGALFFLAGAFANRGPGYGMARIRSWRAPANWLRSAAFVLVVLLVMLRYAAAISNPPPTSALSPTSFNLHDDFHTYFVFPTKMLAQGSLGPDPFSQTRIVSSLGGQYFLQSLVLSVMEHKNLHLMDPGVSLWILMGMVLGLARRQHLSFARATWLLLFLALFPPPTANTSALLNGACLFLGLCCMLSLAEKDRQALAVRALSIAVLAAAICALKSSFIPACILLLACSYFPYLIRSKFRRDAILECALLVLFSGAFLLPWMISLDQSSGTLLFPVLGKGFHGSAYGTFLSPSAGLTLSRAFRFEFKNLTSAIFVALILLGGFLFWLRRPAPTQRDPALSIWAGALGGAIILVIALGGIDTYRYSFAPVFAALLFLLVELLSWVEMHEVKKRSFAALAACTFAAGLMLGAEWEDARRMFLGDVQAIQFGIRGGALLPPRKAVEYRNVQSAVPPGGIILARLEHPFLLDFRRNPIFIVEWPGGASPPPGMPCFKGSEALASYLLSHSVRYVTYAYASETGFSRQVFASRLSPDQHPWVRTQAEHAFDFQDNLKQLGETRRRIYDDGEIFVLDLAAAPTN